MFCLTPLSQWTPPATQTMSWGQGYRAQGTNAKCKTPTTSDPSPPRNAFAGLHFLHCKGHICKVKNWRMRPQSISRSSGANFGPWGGPWHNSNLPISGVCRLEHTAAWSSNQYSTVPCILCTKCRTGWCSVHTVRTVVHAVVTTYSIHTFSKW